MMGLRVDLICFYFVCMFIEIYTIVTYHTISSISSVAQSCLTLCDPMARSTPGLLVHHQLLELTQTHVH